MRRYIEEPETFAREFETVLSFMTDETNGEEPSHGEECVAYLKLLASQETEDNVFVRETVVIDLGGFGDQEIIIAGADTRTETGTTLTLTVDGKVVYSGKASGEINELVDQFKRVKRVTQAA